MNKPNDFQELITYLLIYAANVDAEFHEDEKAFIKEHYSATAFETMLKVYNSHTMMESIEFIRNGSAEWIKDEQSKLSVLEEIKKLTKADNRVTAMEKTFISFLDRIL